MKKQVSLFSVCIFALGCLVAANAWSFNFANRTAIADNAIFFSPANIRAFLEDNRDEVLDGMTYDYTTHAQISPAEAGRIFEILVERLRAGALYDANTVRSMGVLAAHIAEAFSPGHLNTTHFLNPEKVEFAGIVPVDNPGWRVNEIIEAHKAFQNDKRDEVLVPRYALAVNEIVSFWTAAWQAAGLNPGASVEPGTVITRDAIIVQTSAAPLSDMP
ncbi:MAG: hypothetical protein QMD09_00470 [Desulfatibacillaceae bacterium]|nr:hypothetical protein [Desulfatibacillaceae bacterium]